LTAARTFFSSDTARVIQELGKDKLLQILRQMLLIRNFETRAEGAYLQGFVGGFFHSYIGQEAIQTAAVEVFGKDQWWITSYRCHALALLLGVTPDEAMAEFYGRSTGNAKGRGGSMHLYTDRLMGGFGIVGGQIPIAAGAAFALKYKKEKGKVALGFLGDGAVVQGAFHEALNLAALWDLPLITVIENNMWGMGTAVNRAVSVDRLAEDKAPGYGMKGYTFDGMDFFNCYAGFKRVFEQIKKDSRPVLIECVCERFKGHSISDPGLYRTREALKETMHRDPIHLLKDKMIEAGFLDEDTYKQMDKELREQMQKAMKFAEESPWPELSTLETDVFAP
jgi:pyruvate dehydrogenase E1 component alpha subunit